MSAQSEGEEFTISCEGENTGEQYKGKFTAKRFLSHRDRVAQDRIYRELLGVRPGDANVEAAATASAVAQCRVRLLDAPSWWKDADGGLDLKDQQPLLDVLEAVVKIEQKALDEVRKKAEEAQKRLKEAPDPTAG